MMRNENSSNDIKRNEDSGNDIKRNEISVDYGAVNISTTTSISTSISISGITELFISVNKNLDRVF